METVEINTYDNVFEVSKQWLLANTEADSVEEFLDTYTWDEGEWLYFLYQKDEREFEIGILTSIGRSPPPLKVGDECLFFYFMI